MASVTLISEAEIDSVVPTGTPAPARPSRSGVNAALKNLRLGMAGMPVPVTRFGANPASADNTTALQSALDSGEALWLPPGRYRISEPLSYASDLYLHSATGRAEIFGTFEGPLLHSRGDMLRTDNTRVGDGANATRLDFRGVHFRNAHDLGCCVQLSNLRAPAMVTGCRFTMRFRGLLFIESTFGAVVQGCFFQGSWAGRTADTWDYTQAWGLVLCGHATAIENQFAGLGTGAMLIGVQANMLGGRIEVCGYGLRLGGINLAVNQAWNLSRSFIGGISMESNYRNLFVDRLGDTTTVQNIAIHGGTGQSHLPGGIGDYGMLIRAGGHATNTIQNIRAAGRYHRAAVIYGDNGVPFVRGIAAHNGEPGKPVFEGEPLGVRGPTASRPDPAALGPGTHWYDTTLGRPIWSNGAAWTDAAGTAM